MSDETPMNTKLKNLEAELQGMLLVSNKLTRGESRDELMYQAGWAAAMASLAESDSSENSSSEGTQMLAQAELPRPASRTSHMSWVWPTATAAATFAALWFGILLLQNPATGLTVAQLDVPASKIVEESELIQGDLEIEVERTKAPTRDLVRDVLDFPRGEVLSTSFAFTNRTSSMNEDASSGSREAAVRTDLPLSDDLPSKTHRELLQELLNRT